MALSAERRLERLLEEGDPEGVFFLHGDAVRIREEAARRIVDAALDPATRDFNLDVFRGEDVEPRDLAGALSTPPMMAARRVVSLSGAEGLTPTGRKAVLAAVEAPPAGLTFVITATIPERSKAAFWRTLRERCRGLEFSAPRGEEIPGWLIERAASRHGARLEGAAARALVAAVGEDLSRLDAELGKLASAAADGVVTPAAVRDLVPRVRGVDRWEWLDGVASRRYEEALADLDGVLVGDSGVGLLMAMVEQHLYLGVAVESGRSGVRRGLEEAGKAWLAWKARVYASQARAWSAAELRRAVGLMHRADRRLKTGGADRDVLQELLLALRLLREKAA